MNVTPVNSRNPDRWIEGLSDFSRPICIQLRDWVMRWEPDLAESIKWNVLCFTGRKLVCGISGCKKHVNVASFVALSSWIRTISLPAVKKTPRFAMCGSSLPKTSGVNRSGNSVRSAVDLDLNPDILPPPPRQRGPVEVPEILANALKKNKKAAATFANFAPTYQREYIYWVSTAKREETRQRRLAETMAALSAGHKWVDRKN